MPRRSLVLVLGAARSGTSAVTRVLALCGCALPASLLPAASMNPTGFWEPVDATGLNVEFLIKNDTTVGDPSMRLEGEAALEAQGSQDFIERVSRFLKEGATSSLLVVKCAGTAELLRYWLAAAEQAGLDTKIVIAFRHPVEVVASASAASHQSLEGLSANWLKVNLIAERNSRTLPRVFVDYHNLLGNWRSEVVRMSDALAIDLVPDERAIEEFITLDLYRQRRTDPIIECFSYDWMSRVYETISAAARGASLSFGVLDEIYDAYQTNERTFRIAWDEWRPRIVEAQRNRVTT